MGHPPHQFRQRSQASLAQLSRELGINPKTVAKWRKRVTVEGMKTGPKEPRSRVLTEAEEAAIVAFRRHTLLPLDDCLYALQPSIPHLTRSALHRFRQRSQASLAQLSRELGINPKTVAKWRKRVTVEGMKTGPKEPRSRVLTEAEEAAIVAFRRHTLLPLEACRYALQPSIPHLTRSALHRGLQRHGISRLPDIEGDKPGRQKFKRYPIGFFHIHCPAVLVYMHERGYRRGADCRRKALSLRGHRSNQQVRRDPTC